IAARRFQRDEDANGGVFALHRADQVAHIAGFDMARFHLHKHALRLIVGIIDKSNNPVDTLITAFLAGLAALLTAERFSSHQRQGPPLELIAIIARQLFCRSNILRLAYNFELAIRKHCLQTIFLEGDAEVRYINADPPATQLLRGGNGCATAAKRVEYHIARFTARLDDTL